MPDRLLISFCISLTVHAGAVGVGVWHFHSASVPTVGVESGRAGEEPASITVMQPTPQLSADSIANVSELPPVETREAVVAPIQLQAIEVPVDVPESPGWNATPPTEIASSHEPSSFGMPSQGNAEMPSPFVPAQSGNSQEHTTTPGDGIAAGGAPSPLARNRQPKYPPDARRRGQQGTTMLRIEISESGKVENISRTTPDPPGFGGRGRKP